ncbi:hypothetical protein L7F22_001730 [Adiantum nelumboides]|nr:hypothetical protein [Adiantum nelumboides]
MHKRVKTLRRIENALCGGSHMKCESQRLKLTSFDKLLQVTCGSLKNVRMCSEPDARSKFATKSPRTAPDAAEVQLKSPNWLYGQSKQELTRSREPRGASALPSVNRSPEVFDNMDLNRLLELENFREMEVFERYLNMASTEDDSWYGCGLLPGSVEDSEANKHYAQFCQMENLDPFNLSLEDKEGCSFFSLDDIRDGEDESVLLEMQAAMNEYQDIGKDLGSMASWSYPKDADMLTHCILGREELHSTLHDR